MSFAVAPVSNKLLDDVKSMNLKGTNSISEGYVASAVLPYVKEGADYVLPEVAKNIHLNSTFDYPTGLRHFMPINMAFWKISAHLASRFSRTVMPRSSFGPWPGWP